MPPEEEEKTLEELGAEAAEARVQGREKFKEAADEMAEAAAETPEKIMEATERGVAKSLAAGSGQDIRSLSGATTEAQRAGEEAAQTAKQEAAAKRMEAETAKEEAGDEAADFSAQRTEYTAARNAIIDKHKGFWNDDEDAMYTELLKYAEDPTLDPDLVKDIRQEAEDIKSGKWDV
jgi:hypothetical protein